MIPEFFKKYNFERLFQQLKIKYKTYGKVTGKIKIENLDKTEVIAFEEIGVFFNEGDTIIYNTKELKKFLDESIYSGITLEELLFEYFNNEFKTNFEIKEKFILNKENYFKEILDEFKNTKAYNYLEAICLKKESIYKTITLRYNENKENLRKELLLIGNALNNLPIFKNQELQNITIYSEKITGDPHYFDETDRHFKLLYEGIKFILNIKTDNDTVIEKNKILYKVGLTKESLLNNITIYGFNGINKKDKENKIFNASITEKEFLTISLNHLNSLKTIKSVSPKIYIFENPSVFSYIFEYFKSKNNKIPTLICTAGQLNFATYLFLDKLERMDINNEKIEIYYSGDIDPEGLLIANNLINNYKNIKLFGYNKEIYLNHLSGKKISNERLKKLNKLDKIDNELIKCLNEKKEIAFQEKFIDELIEFIEN
ncbi:MAG: hypothetical protein PWP46_489 [Fusobacteriaceae bacterium]|jgi:uncharacterized protein (TIGR02679 family)|nr:hypothetical protein [Fusobacteriales bacterium]MDN5303610.1 hypothetical protein [Fusobacteriaceae bacterium]